MSAVEYTHEAGIARIHLNRPDRLNAVVPALVDGLLDAFDRASADGARVVVLAGRGRAFCSGYDLKEPDLDETALQTRARVERIQDVTRAFRRFPGIVVGAVHGYALGAGAEFALGCDLVVASEDAQLGFPEVGVGLSVTGGISQLLPLVVGPMRAKELLLLGERVDAERAREMGLVNRVVPQGTHEDHALELARRVTERPALATAIAKQTIDRGVDATLDQALAHEVEHALLTRAANERDVFAPGD
ncbi:enoyl-CoA hydratase/isomerase family protein [Solicola sp. PLA-1-18]|uniref:enoyl-CoA hydratase/isomerase family protein n=1 Tax=Solicola sp. PLA-1-18 TaxID=3380532 RepID=UPI003B770539